ncbi:molecular chaperone DnaJ [bacterium (Candidatus Torokbacteria) CG_4_10_14_0_2_um_filter_35_8]|nr:MAG: molecular chaperone DnaJ [bacterium (Candidatus Torokbacteria) CG_4_10_14_0_2_um_filter_35_8]
MAKDYYEILGVSRDVSQEEIKKAYHKLAHKYHPDRGGDEAKMKEVNEAYATLRNPKKRGQYDQLGQTFDGAGASGFPGGFDFSGFQRGGTRFDFDFSDLGGFSSVFDDFFGRDREGEREAKTRGSDLEMEVEISLKDAVFGTEKEVEINKYVTCRKCSGSGTEPGSKVITCQKCGGSGRINSTRNTFFGTFSTITTCPNCEGEGKIPEKKCTECGGIGRVRSQESLKVKIPAGISDGQSVRLRGKGESGVRDGVAGDLYVTIRVKPNRFFIRRGFDLDCVVPISFVTATLGGVVSILTIDGKDVDLRIPAGTEAGKNFRIRGKGVSLMNSSGRGDQIVEVQIETPKKLSQKAKRLLEEFNNEISNNRKQKFKFW